MSTRIEITKSAKQNLFVTTYYLGLLSLDSCIFFKFVSEIKHYCNIVIPYLEASFLAVSFYYI